MQLLGFSDWATGTLTVCTTLGAALGFLIGGWLSDMLAWRFPNAARPFINQLSAAMTLPLTVVLYKAAPGAPSPPPICSNILVLLNCLNVEQNPGPASLACHAQPTSRNATWSVLPAPQVTHAQYL